MGGSWVGLVLFFHLKGNQIYGLHQIQDLSCWGLFG